MSATDATKRVCFEVEQFLLKLTNPGSVDQLSIGELESVSKQLEARITDELYETYLDGYDALSNVEHDGMAIVKKYSR